MGSPQWKAEAMGTYGANAFGLHDVHGNVFAGFRVARTLVP